MKKVTAAGSILLSLGVAALSAAQVPKPGPEVARLAVWVGTWQYEGEVQASPVGPAAKVSGQLTSRMVMDGFALEWAGEEKGPFGGVRWAEVDVYDAAAKNYAFLFYYSDGAIGSGTFGLNGNAWRYTGRWVTKEKAYRFREDRSFSADGKTWTWKAEISTDGKTWVPVSHGKVTKQ